MVSLYYLFALSNRICVCLYSAARPGFSAHIGLTDAVLPVEPILTRTQVEMSEWERNRLQRQAIEAQQMLLYLEHLI